jgi:hypothetical protein
VACETPASRATSLLVTLRPFAPMVIENLRSNLLPAAMFGSTVADTHK